MKLRLTGALLTRAAVTLSAAQDGRTAGPASVTDWGTPPDPPPSSDWIVVEAPEVLIVPATLSFYVDFSNLPLETLSGPAEGEYHDPRLTETTVIWDFGDEAAIEFAKPLRVLDQWRDSNRAYGPFVGHVYRTAGGPRTGTCTVIEPDGTTHTASFTVPALATPESYYPEARRVYINPVGDSDFGDAPAGATKLNLDRCVINGSEKTAALDAALSSGSCWVRWKAGADFVVNILPGNATIEHPHHFFDSYGTGRANLITTGADDSSGSILFANSAYGEGFSVRPDMRVRSLRFAGEWDATFETYAQALAAGRNGAGVAWSRAGVCSVDDCIMDGLLRSSWVASGDDSRPTSWVRMHVNDCECSNVGGQYPIYSGGTTDANVAILATGNATRHAQDGYSANASDNNRGLVRTQHVKRQFWGCNEFCSTAWHNAAFKPNETPIRDGDWLVVDGLYAEGSHYQIEIGGNFYANEGQRKTQVMNAVFDGVILVADATSTGGAKINASGVLMRNVLICNAATPRFHFANSYVEAIRVMVGLLGSTPPTWQTVWPDGAPAETWEAPVTLENITFVGNRSAADNDSATPRVVQRFAYNIADLPNVIVRNCAKTGTWLWGTVDGGALPSGDEPLSVSGLTTTSLWAPYNNGWHPPAGYFVGTLAADVAPGESFTIPGPISDTTYQMTAGMVDLHFCEFRIISPLVSTRTGTVSQPAAGTGGWAMSVTTSGITVTHNPYSTTTLTAGSTYMVAVPYKSGQFPAGEVAAIEPTHSGRSYKTPTDTAKQSRQQAGSALIGAAASGTAMVDIARSTRPTTGADLGPWQGVSA